MSARSLFIAVCSALLSAAFVSVRAPLSFCAFALIAASVALAQGALLGSLPALRAPNLGLRALCVGLGLAAWPLSVLGRVLKTTTHHRPLGAVTFAFLALFVTGGLVALALRVVTRRTTSVGALFASRLLEGAALLALLGLLVRVIRDPATQHGAVDVAFALGSAALLCLLPLPERLRTLAERVGPWLWGVVVVVGVALAFGPARMVAAAASPALAAPLSWF